MSDNLTNTTKLYHKDGREAQIGDTLTDFRGDTTTLTGWPRNGGPRLLGKINKVWVQDEGDSYNRELYPSVFGLSWDKPEPAPSTFAQYTAETLSKGAIEQITKFFQSTLHADRGDLTAIERATLNRAADDLTTILSWAKPTGEAS